MRIPLSWLREYVRVEAEAQQIADALSISTAEVNGIHRVGVLGDLSLFRVGHVLEAAKHPDADRLQLTSVDVGRSVPTRSSAARGTSARARRSRWRCPAPPCPTA
jgi:phenylalanyl-tRNA synthetase beta chain